MGWLRSAEEVEEMIEEMKKKTKGKYITQGVTFNKESARQMELLKYALMYSSSFSGLGKELIAEKFDGTLIPQKLSNKQQTEIAPIENKEDAKDFFK